MMRPVVMPVRSAECGVRNGSDARRNAGLALASEPALQFRTPHSAFRTCSDLPIREQNAAGRLGLRIAIVGHAEIGPADAVPAGDEAAERLRVACLAADRHAPDPGARRGGLGGGDCGLEGALVR